MSCEVDSALEALLTGLRLHHEQLAAEAQRATRSLRYGAARQAIAKAEEMTAVIGMVANAQERWRAIDRGESRPKGPGGGTPRKPKRGSQRRGKSLLTPHAFYCRPILQALVKLGGAAPTPAVIEEVEATMADRLTPADREPYPSHPSGKPCWQHRVHWTRHRLVKAGLMKPKVRQGVWEISEEGRRWLADGRPVPRSVPGWRKVAEGD
jgi:hypothetical protein